MDNYNSHTKNTGLSKMIKILSSPDLSRLKHFLKRHSIILDESYYDKIQNYCDIIEDKLKENNEPIEVNKENARMIVLTYIAAVIEKIWMKQGINFISKPISYTCKVIRRNKNTVLPELLEALDLSFIEIEEFISHIVPDSEIEPNDILGAMKKTEV